MHPDTVEVGVSSRECPDIVIKIASTREEREGAFHLTHKAYTRAGLAAPNKHALRITPHQLLPTTDVFVAVLRGEVVSTLSLVRDGQLGLPMEEIYPEEVRERRARGLRLAEVSCLADRRKDQARFFGLFSDLARLMVRTAESEGVDQLLIAVHPRHARMYRRAMAFAQIGDERQYPCVLGNSAVPLCLDIEFVKRHRAEIWERFAGEPLPGSVLKSQPMTDPERRAFQRLMADAEDPVGTKLVEAAHACVA